VLRQQLTGTRNRLAIRVQVTLRRAQVSVAGDLPEYMHGHASVSHPRQPCVPQAVTLELLVAKFGDDLVPASCIPKRGRHAVLDHLGRAADALITLLTSQST
jgi:hypothetical protein